MGGPVSLACIHIPPRLGVPESLRAMLAPPDPSPCIPFPPGARQPAVALCLVGAAARTGLAAGCVAALLALHAAQQSPGPWIQRPVRRVGGLHRLAP